MRACGGEDRPDAADELYPWRDRDGRERGPQGVCARDREGAAHGGGVGIYVRRDPDTVRAADVLYISHERYSRRESKSYLDVAPELVVEILSPDDLWSEVMEKLSEYFSAGVDVVWVLDPRKREVFSYRSLTEVQRFGEGQILTDEEILPGFTLPVSALFRG